tara:strand:- start:481 stop:783 length:303 start_codon:yes stop_codon:yes gene_type:complete
MSFFLSPFKFLFELIGFLLSAAFVYGLALIVAITIIVYGITDLKSRETVTVVEYKERVVTEYVPVIEKEEPKLTCERIAGCEVFPKATTDKEYCPTCVMK